ncbi:unnamed protein product [Anisakis simplex]|uniref:Secreted protein n=1 Tax=Anisakis simplex TaxID=6269 RepID=A0A0M3JVX5_ANISI|nr:unnamed protein product [Anisakis simplex]
MWFLFSFFGLLLLSQDANALKCFTEYTFVRGQNVGTSMETCSGKNDYCYNVTADTNIVHKVKAAGCASIKCIVSEHTSPLQANVTSSDA